MDSFVLVQLKDKAGRPGVFDAVSKLRQKLNQQFPGVEFAFDTGGMMTAALNMGEPSPIHFQITGSKLDTAQHIARIVKDEAAQVPGSVDVRIAQRMDYPTLEIEMDRISAAYQGVNVDDVMKNLVSATNSSINFDPAFSIAPNGNHYFLGVQYAEKDINSLVANRFTAGWCEQLADRFSLGAGRTSVCGDQRSRCKMGSFVKFWGSSTMNTMANCKQLKEM